MKNFKYSARDQSGKIVRGEMTAKSKVNVVESLQTQGLVVVDVSEGLAFGLNRLKEVNVGGVPIKDKVVFMRQLSTMISAGLPLTQALEILQKQAGNPLFSRVLQDVLSEVQGGTSLSKAFRKNDSIFDEITINLIDAGESSGHLEEVLLRLATELEKSKKLQEKVKSAFIYPVIVVSVAIVVVIILMLVLVPAMKDIYAEFDAQLPLPTQILIAVSDFTLKFWWLVIIFVCMLIAGFKVHYDTPDGKKLYHSLLLKFPVFGELMVKIQVAQFTRVLALLMASGISIIEALRLTANSLSNINFRETVYSAKSEVEKGTPLAIPLSRNEFFPLIVSQMVSVGEESGELDMVLNKMAEYYSDEVDTMTGNLSSLLEPFILIFLGATVGFIAIAVYTPIFNLSSVIG